ncbi:MAG: hypothetical protein KatS3mg110_4207 [Pirellulaceae bacterium]|nr:MAG: hypothetical protein KatS3mg110_4207 [Pirellulaceae bacterium]
MKRPSRINHHGSLTVMVIVFLAVFGAIAGATSWQQLKLLRQRRVWVDERQQYWLVRAAAERAASRLERDPGYAGEIWQPPVLTESGLSGIKLRIHVPASDSARQVTIEFEGAEFVSDFAHRKFSLPILTSPHKRAESSEQKKEP